MKAAFQKPAVVLVFSADDVERYLRALTIGVVLICERLGEFGARLEALAERAPSSDDELRLIKAEGDQIGSKVDSLIAARAHLQTLLNEVTRCARMFS